jgi:exopolysaccharide biosynthesis polyprenyl glycosylphosphotransferase
VSNVVIMAQESRSEWTPTRLAVWTRAYLRQTFLTDIAMSFVVSATAIGVRFDGHVTYQYAGLSLAFPALWVAVLRLAGAYDQRFVGTGSDEFRKVINAGVSLTAALAIFSYLINIEISRFYLLVSMPSVVVLGLVARYVKRKRLHRKRALGQCLSGVVAVGYPAGVADLVSELRRDSYHGLSVVAACVAGIRPEAGEVAGVPVLGGVAVDEIAEAVRHSGADTVAVLSCPEIDGVALRLLAWELEKTGTDLCVAPALLDVAGPRTTVRPTAGLTLLHVDHPRLSGPLTVLKGLFDRTMAAVALALLAPALLAIAVAVKLGDKGPALFTQTRVGKDGHTFKIYKFRTMVVDAEARLAELTPANDLDGVLFKLRRDPRITPVGATLRKYSIDEFPQFINVLKGEMSLVGPRPALPSEAAKYADHVHRRLVVKPGLTGMWQVNGRSDLSWDESVRLDLRYVENWSFALDLQILWKTVTVLLRGSGAY